MDEIGQVLTEQPRCVVVAGGMDGSPVAMPLPFWFDGAGLWLLCAAVGPLATALRADERCAVGVRAAGHAVSLQGRARVLGAHDPLGLALHAPAIGLALAGAALKHAPDLAGYARDVARVPLTRWPAGLAVLRIVADAARLVEPPAPGPGMAPALPAVVPADLRRRLSGRREAVVATPGPRVAFATWSAPMALGMHPPDLAASAAAAAVVLDGHDVALALHGPLHEGTLTPVTARWWRGAESGETDVPTAFDSVVVPD